MTGPLIRSVLLVVTMVFALYGCSSDPESSTPASDNAGADAIVEEDGANGDVGEELSCAPGTACDDGDPCTDQDTCDPDGVCLGSPMSCDDGLDCTADSCGADGCDHELDAGFCLSSADSPSCVALLAPDPANTCRMCNQDGTGAPVWTNLADGAPCEDGDACTVGDLCELGGCVSKNPIVCPEPESACTAAVCDSATGCGFVSVEGPCDDGDVCTSDDTCENGACIAGETALACDDGDPCTTDSCDPVAGCLVTPKCVDEDPCTLDSCQEDGSCVFPVVDGPCDDGDPCTVGEVCVAGDCGGGGPNDCDDDNPCTSDVCVSGAADDSENGCQHYFLDGVACNDGLSCTGPDLCVSGLCVGEKIGCSWCPVPDTTHAVKATQFELATDGFPGSGLDVDDDPDTCAPSGNCNGGVDNALAPLATLMNDPMYQSVVDGSLIYVADLSEATPEVLASGEPFFLSILDCGLLPPDEPDDLACDYQTETCNYVAVQDNFTGACSPWFYFDDARYENGVVTAGGKGHIITILMALSGGADVPLTIGHARFQANAVLDVSGDKIVAMNGVIAGATPKAQLMETVDKLNPDVLTLPKEDIITLLELLVEDDLDLDGDGTNDAASVGLRFTMIPGVLKNP